MRISLAPILLLALAAAASAQEEGGGVTVEQQGGEEAQFLNDVEEFFESGHGGPGAPPSEEFEGFDRELDEGYDELDPGARRAVTEEFRRLRDSYDDYVSAVGSGDEAGAGAAGRGMSESLARIRQQSPRIARALADMYKNSAQTNVFSGASKDAAPAERQAHAELMGDFAKAFPTDPGLRTEYAKSLLASGQYAAAAREASNAVKRDPASLPARTTLAQAKFHAGDYRGSVESARWVLERAPDDPNAAAVLKLAGAREGPTSRSGWTALQGGAVPASRASGGPDAARAVSAPPQARPVRVGSSRGAEEASAPAPLDLARRFLDIVALLKDKRWPAALRAVDRAIRRFPAEAGLYALRSFIRNKLGDHALALADAEKAIALNPANANAYLNRAWAMDALRMDPVAVVSSLSKAAELESRFGKYAGPMSPGELSRMMEGAEGLYETEEARPRARQRPAWLFVFAVLAAAAFLLRRRLRSALRRGLG